jgi:pimeloyl-ACP methyl ester carboxylesterase
MGTRVATKSIIAETEHVSAIAQDIGGDTVIVTFNEMGFVRNGTNFWGDDFLLKLGVSAIGIVTPRPNWYPPRDMNEVIPAVLRAVAGRRVVTYGHSQGGFGALKFSARLGASVALCFCPQWTIDPKDVGSFDTRTTNYFDPALDNGVRLVPEDVCSNSFIFYDKMEKTDARHAAILSRYEGVKPVLVPFSEHDTIRILTEGRGASTVINLCRTATPPTVRDFRQVIRRSRGHSKTYHDYKIRNLLLRLRHSRSRSSVFLTREFSKAGKPSQFYTALMAHAGGDAILARSALANATVRDFEGIDLLFLWSLTNSLEFFDAELAVAAQMRSLQPGNTWACLHAVKTLTRAGHLHEAQAELTRISRNPDAGEYPSYFTEFAALIRQLSAQRAAPAA